MRGLLVKDFLAQRKMFIFFVVVLLFSSLIALGGQIELLLSSIIGVLSVMSGVMILSVLTIDDHCKWTTFSASIPISRRTIVMEKYLFGILILLMMDIFLLLIGWLSGDLFKALGAILSYSGFMIWYIVTFYPFRILFFDSSHKDSILAMVYPLLLLGPVLLQFYYATSIDRLRAQELLRSFLSSPVQQGAILLGVILLLLASIEISVRGFEKKDL